MAADAYITMAISQLRDAEAELHTEISEIQHDAYDTERQLHGEISQAEYNAATVSAEIRAKDALHESDHRQDLQNRLAQLHAEIGQKKQHVSQKSSDAASIVQRKLSLQSAIHNIASQLEPLVSQARQ